jgi:beta-galactosidase
MKNPITRIRVHYILRRLFLASFVLWSVGIMAQIDNGRERCINEQWKFQLNDTVAASRPDFDDSQWRTLDLPHDWSIEGVPLADNPAGNDGGYYPTGIGWYRKTFHCDENDLNLLTSIYFEGVYMNAQVFINGYDLGVHPYGYTSFFHNLTPYLKQGKNVLAVRVDNSQQKNSRWYTGSGIYRNVKLIRTPRLHFEPWGIVIRTTTEGRHTQVCVDATVVNEQKTSTSFSFHTCIFYEGETQVSQRCSVTLEAGETRTIRLQMPLEDACMWSPETPELYALTCSLEQGGTDVVTKTFGVRTLECDTRKGLRLNGESIELNGACLHHDNGPLGAAAYRDAEWRKVRLLKEAGFNAVRTSHNPPSEAFLDACDHLGLLVIDESFDGWSTAKNPYDYSAVFDQWWMHDIESMVKRDRNHPSIFCWSIGNEIIERKSPEAVLTAYAMTGLVHKYDPTRPVTSALCAWDSDWEIYDPLAAAHDIAGYNYLMHKAASDHERVPSRIIMQTESYPRNAFTNWAQVVEHPYIIGDFVWTGIDYLGESGIGRFYYKGQSEGEHYVCNHFPWHGAYCGDIDVTGWRKPISYYRDLLYNPRAKKIHLAVKEPSGYYGEVKETAWSVWPTWENWNWPGHEGKDIQVEICSRYPAVRLYLNNQLVGELPTTRKEEFKAVFALPYQPGELRAVGVENGKEVDPQLLVTAGKPYHIRLTADCTELTADGQSLAYVVAEITDRKGRLVPIADNLLDFTLEGPGTLLATCSADLTDSTAYTLPQRKAWKGRALVVVKSGKETGELTLTVKAKGLKTEILKLKVTTSR